MGTLRELKGQRERAVDSHAVLDWLQRRACPNFRQYICGRSRVGNTLDNARDRYREALGQAGYVWVVLQGHRKRQVVSPRVGYSARRECQRRLGYVDRQVGWYAPTEGNCPGSAIACRGEEIRSGILELDILSCAACYDDRHVGEGSVHNRGV